MSATKQKQKPGKMPEAERLARRERRILKRVAAYQALMAEHEDRRSHLVELLLDRVEELEQLSPDGSRPSVWEPQGRLWVKSREDLYRYKLELDAMGQREAVKS